MRITPYSSAYTYYNNRQVQRPQRQHSPYFGNLMPHDIASLNRLEKFINRGYKLISDDVEIISPQGTKLKGVVFIKDNISKVTKNWLGANVIVTDNGYTALGELNCSKTFADLNHKALACSIRNYTNQYNLSPTFLEPEFEALEYKDGGKYSKVGTRLYDTLIKYVKENHPEYDALYASVRSQGSWDFHSKYGFTMDFDGTWHPIPDDYDTYCPSANYLFYRLN